MVGTVEYVGMNAQYRESAEDTGLGRLFDTFADRRIYSFGIAPPTTEDSNLKVSSPLGSMGSKCTLQCPYCPRPPDCLAYLLSTSTALVMVSL